MTLDIIGQATRNAVEAGFNVGMHQHVHEITEFVKWLLLCEQPHNVVEIGTLHGGTAVMWSAIATGKVITVDKPMGRFGGADHGLTTFACQERAKKLASISPRIVSVLGDSKSIATYAEVLGHLGKEQIDLLFIDGDHTLEGVSDDYELYRQLVRKGGVIAFHDINTTEFHVNAGCFVHELWAEILKGDQYSDQYDDAQVFTIGADWGGIGALVKGDR